jgi:HEAT repeat protein
MTTSLNTLCTLRSRHAEELKAYLARVIEVADRTLWSRQGRPVRPTDIVIPIRTIVEDRSLDKDRQEQDEREKQLRDKIDEYKITDSNRAKLLEFELGEKKRKFARWDQELFRPGKVLVKSGPGGGKSFLTAISAIRIAERGLKDFDEKRIPVDAYHLPILIELPKWVEQCSKEDPSAAFFEYLQQTYGMSEMLWDKIQARLGLERKDGHSPGSRNAWFILDSLDQVPSHHREKLKRWLELLEHQPNVIVTCRTVQYQSDFLPYGTHEKYKSVELAPFRRQETRQFVSKWFEKDPAKSMSLNEILQSGGNLEELARTPFLLTLCCLAHGERALAADIRKVELFGRFLPDMVRGAYSTKIKKKWEADDPKVYEELSGLVRVARYLYERNRSGNLFSLSGLKRALKKAGVSESDQTAKIKWMLKRDLIVFAGHTQGDRKQVQYSFPHRSILEYLAARGIYEENIERDPGEPAQGIPPEEDWTGVLRELDARSWDPNFWEIIGYLAGMAHDPWPMLERIADPMQDDAMGYRQSLALRAMGEVRKEWRELKQGDFERISISLINGQMTFFGEYYITEKFDYLIKAYATFLNQVGYERFTNAMRWNPGHTIIFGWMKSTKAIELLINRLDHEVNWVREDAAKALGLIGSEKAIEPLINRLDDLDHYVSEAIMEAIGLIGSEKAIEPLINRLNDPEHKARVAAAEVLGLIGSEKAFEPLTSRLDDANKFVRFYAARGIGLIGSEKAFEPLINRLDDPDHYVSEAIMEAIGHISSEKAIEPLINRLNDPEHKVGESAAKALGHIGSEKAIEPLIARLDDAKYWVRESAAKALGHIGSEKAIEPLINRLNDPEHEVRQAVAEALGHIGSEKAIEPLINRLNDPEHEVRQAVAEALGFIGSEKAIEPLIARLDDAKYWVRESAAKALGHIGSEKAIEPLIARLVDPNNPTRDLAAKALGLIGSEKAIEPLIARLADTDSIVIHNAAEALGLIGSDRAIEPLISRLLPVPDRWMRQKAAEVIRTITKSGSRFKIIHEANRLVLSSVHELVSRFLTGQGWPESSKD